MHVICPICKTKYDRDKEYGFCPNQNEIYGITHYYLGSNTERYQIGDIVILTVSITTIVRRYIGDEEAVLLSCPALNQEECLDLFKRLNKIKVFQ